MRSNPTSTQTSRLLLITLLSTALTACGPIGPMPGLALGGTETKAPANFEQAAAVNLVQIKTKRWGWLPQVHHIWAVGIDDAVYAVAVPNASWRKQLEADPNVQLRMGDATYHLIANQISSDAERRRAYDAYVAKYAGELEEILGRKATIADAAGMIAFRSYAIVDH